MSDPPRWLREICDGDAVDAIAAAVAKGERRTSGEVVPMIVLRSSAIGHVFLLVYLSLLMMLTLIGFAAYAMTHHPWFLPAYAVLAVAIVPLSSQLARSLKLQRMVTAPFDRQQQVDARAQLEFYYAGLHNVTGATGILIFVSVMEHRATVLAGEAIANKLPPETWAAIVDDLVACLKRRDIVQGFNVAVERCTEILAVHFPIQENDRDEIQNNLVIKE